jgi:hypothetical protein
MVWRYVKDGEKYYYENVNTRGQAETVRTQLKKQGWKEVKTEKTEKGFKVLWRGAPKKARK